MESHLAELAIWEKLPGFNCACEASRPPRTARCVCTVSGIRQAFGHLLDGLDDLDE